MFKPMLAATLPPGNDLAALVYPLLASPKLDGVRATVQNGQVYSRNHELIPNLHVQKLFGLPKFNGCDGELIVGSATAPDVFRQTMSAVMRREGTPPVEFCVFDYFAERATFMHRLEQLHKAINGAGAITMLTQATMTSAKQLEDFEAACLEQGYEGVMLRRGDRMYKQGRSTLREFSLVKLKRFLDGEAIVLSLEEQ